MPQPIQQVQPAPVNPPQAAVVPARALPPQPIASSSSLQSLSSSDKGCLRKTWDYFISILESIYAYCLCRRSSTPPPAANPPAPSAMPIAPSAMPISNPVNLEQRQDVQEFQAPQAVAPVENSEVSDIESESDDDDENLGPMLTLIESHQIVEQLYQDLMPGRLENLVTSERWEEIQQLVDQLARRESHRAATAILKKHLENFQPLVRAALEWERYLEEGNDVEPFRREIFDLSPRQFEEALPSILSRAREELRKSPADMDHRFITITSDTLRRNNLMEENRELFDTLNAAKELNRLHENRFFERVEDPAIFTPAVNFINEIIEQFSPDRIEQTLNSPNYIGLETERIIESLERRFNELVPDCPQFEYAVGDRVEVIGFMIGLIEAWATHLQTPSHVPPFRGSRDIDIESLDSGERDELIESLLEAAREQVRKPPEQINLARLSSLKRIAERFEAMDNNSYGPAAYAPTFHKFKKMIDIAKGIKELYSEGAFHIRQS